MLWFPQVIFDFSKRLVSKKGMHFVLSSLKLISNLLSTNHSQNSLVKHPQFVNVFGLIENTYQQHKGKNHFMIMIGEEG